MAKGKNMVILVLLSLIAGLVYLTPFLRFSFYDQMKAALNLTDLQMGTVGAVYGVFNVAGYVPGGYLAERFDAKKLILVSCGGMLLSTLWYSFYPGYGAVLVIHALYGVFSVGTFWSAYLKAVRSLAPEEQQGKVFGISEGLRGLGQAGVAFLCLSALGIFASYATGFRVVLWINAAAFALLFAAAWILVPGVKREEETASVGLGKMWKSLKNPGIWNCIFVIMCGYTLWNTVNGYLGTYCTRVLELPEQLSSTLSILRSYIIVFLAGVTGGVLMDRFPSRGCGMMAAYGGTLLSVLGVVLTGNWLWICVALTIVLSYMVNVIKSTYWSILGEAGIPPKDTGMATGIISLIGLTPDIFVSPAVSRFLAWGEAAGSVKGGFDLMWLWMAVWSVLGIGAAWALKKRKKAY